MAAIVAQTSIVAGAAKAASPARRNVQFNGLAKVQLTKPVAAFPAVSNGAKTTAFLVWNPTDNKYFETFSYLPPMTRDQIAKQVDYITSNGFTPCLEFAEPKQAYVANDNTVRMGAVSSNYYDNRYWTMWKLPMFGCTDSSQVLTEIQKCTTAFPDAYVRLVAFDASRQVQCCMLLVHRPASARDHRQPSDRSK